MDRHTIEPLSADEAKAQLRQAAARLGITHWVRRHPVGAVAAGVAAGFLVGRVPRFLTHLSHSRVGQSMIDRLV
jgi:hypothetical protein